MSTIVVATPHSRNNALISALEVALPNVRVVRISSKEELDPAELAILSPRWIFFPHWSWVIPEAVYSRFECVIFHMTDLPYGRGGSPLQNLIVLGHRDTQLSALRCAAELDAGPIYAKRPLTLDGTAEEILTRASALIEELIIWIVRQAPEPVPQEGEVVEFKRRRPEDGNLTGLTDLATIYDRIRMLDGAGYPPAFIELAGIRLEFSAATLCDGRVKATVIITGKSYE